MAHMDETFSIDREKNPKIGDVFVFKEGCWGFIGMCAYSTVEELRRMSKIFDYEEPLAIVRRARGE